MQTPCLLNPVGLTMYLNDMRHKSRDTFMYTLLAAHAILSGKLSAFYECVTINYQYVIT